MNVAICTASKTLPPGLSTKKLIFSRLRQRLYERAEPSKISGNYWPRSCYSERCTGDLPSSIGFRFCGADLPPGWVTCLDFLAQMNLVASMLSQSRQPSSRVHAI